jgi:EF hand associated
MTTLLDHQTTLKYLAYLGFEGDTRRALKVTRPKKQDRKKGKVQRNVFLCYVFGAPGSGKTSLLKAFVNKPFSEKYTPTTKSFNVVNSVEMKGVEKYLVVSKGHFGTVCGLSYDLMHWEFCRCKKLAPRTKQNFYRTRSGLMSVIFCVLCMIQAMSHRLNMSQRLEYVWLPFSIAKPFHTINITLCFRKNTKLITYHQSMLLQSVSWI